MFFLCFFGVFLGSFFFRALVSDRCPGSVPRRGSFGPCSGAWFPCLHFQIATCGSHFPSPRCLKQIPIPAAPMPCQSLGPWVPGSGFGFPCPSGGFPGSIGRILGSGLHPKPLNLRSWVSGLTSNGIEIPILIPARCHSGRSRWLRDKP